MANVSTAERDETKLAQTKLAQELIKTLGLFKNKRKRHEPRWQLQAEYLLPNREILMKGSNYKGMTTHTHVFDGIGNHVLQVWADGILGYMASPMYKWNRFLVKRIPGVPDLNTVPEIKKYLEEYEEAMYAEFKNGGFYQALGTFLRDAGCIGNAYCFTAEHSRQPKLVYKVFHPIEMFIGVNEDGDVDMIFREYNINYRNALKYFGESKLSKERVKTAEDNPLGEFKVLWAIVPRKERIKGYDHSKNMLFASYYIDIGEQKILDEGGFQYMPIRAYRCMLDSGEDYGRGPGSNALKDVKMANQMAETNITSGQKLSDPPWEGRIERRGMIDLRAGGANWVPTGHQLGEIQGIDLGIQLPFAVDQLERIEAGVKRHFFYDFILSLLLAEKKMTAFEVAQKMGEKASVLAPIIHRFMGEGLDGIIYNSTRVADEAGRLPKPPEILTEMGATALDVEYLGLLAQAQRMLFKTHGIMSFLETAAQAYQFSEEAVHDRINWDEVVEDLANAHGMPEKDVRSDEEVKQMREQRAKLRQMMQQAELAKTGAEAGQRMSAAPQPGSPMEALMNAGGVVPGGAA